MFYELKCQYRKGNQDRHVRVLIERDEPIKAIVDTLTELKQGKGKNGKCYGLNEIDKTTVMIPREGKALWMIAVDQPKDPKQTEIDDLDRGLARATTGPGAMPPMLGRGSKPKKTGKKKG